MQYHHTISGLSSVASVQQYEYNDHVEAWLRSQIKVVGPNYYRGYDKLEYRATVANGAGYGYSPDEARNELMASLGF